MSKILRADLTVSTGCLSAGAHRSNATAMRRLRQDGAGAPPTSLTGTPPPSLDPVSGPAAAPTDFTLFASLDANITCCATAASSGLAALPEYLVNALVSQCLGNSGYRVGLRPFSVMTPRVSSHSADS